MKKKLIIPLSIVAVLVIGALIWWFVFKPSVSTGGQSSSDAVYVQAISDITGIGGGISSQTKFSGVVEPQETVGINKDTDKIVAATNVAVGDHVKVGDVLFSYDVDSLSLSVEEKRLQVETSDNTISTYYTQIEDLEKQRSSVSSSEKLSYTLQIQSIQLQIRSEEYNQTLMIKELDSLEKSLENAEVLSPIDGIIKTVASGTDPNSMYQDSYSSGGDDLSGAYITILSTGDYRVKATISELNMGYISEGLPVILTSRVNPEQTWNGSIETIDRENPVSNNNNNYYYSEGSGETSTKYNFYIKLNSLDGLLLGQHLYVELDFGQGEVKEGIWLPSYFIMSSDGTSDVWARGNNDKIEKRAVTLGDYDETTDTYQILEGLSEGDYIAFPEERITNGLATTEEYIMPEPYPDDGSGDMMPDDGSGEYIPNPEDIIVGESTDGAIMYEGDIIEGEATPDGVILEGGAVEDEIMVEGEATTEEFAATESNAEAEG